MESKAAIDRLGERLKAGFPTEGDLQRLDAYRLSVGAAYDQVIAGIRSLGAPVTGRPSKSTLSIVDKLRREHCRLSQIQDIAGCRVIVPGARDQDRYLTQVRELFPDNTVVDRRAKPSNGYRAAHVIIRSFGLPIEVQIRTELQHVWASLSEKLADREGFEVKYGGGSESVKSVLKHASEAVAMIEDTESKTVALDTSIEQFESALSNLKIAAAGKADTTKIKSKIAEFREISIKNKLVIERQRVKYISVVSEYLANPE